ncbi:MULTISPECIES: excinuclease ABC subunit UvrC [Corynebacterium]|uniref:UvrABC system protein C n=2 Tax=Corynebacterium TaxID=1716 RepID=A0AB36RNP0_9CORY|nr:MULTISPECIES: excinuclease ABC subunit UvrC [Corynebacterium]MCG7253216.1 excinuclease ABC subunit UvrC [Corynebacterium hadale]MCG7255513.1 excinuclease ABC subunit UvrC [Corynebacterium hadale]MCG7264396.1 excinuclease ABC subunit UvrC [Corynebacterium hadale]PAT03869.1 excinuclease ABC subunit UvrC [Corynebacterium sp. NML 150383]PAT09232.1 excinuclease ABC subunit UvrC [Corynebacterium hadale]
MANPKDYRPAPGTIPTEPGVYKFRDANGRVVYVGKAKSLRARLNNYFQPPEHLHPRTRQMVFTAASVEWTVVASEVEALQLEYTWIKRFDPWFNVMYRDDKTYPMLAVSVRERYPRAFFYRGPKRKGVRYFGPYSHAWAVRETLDLLTRVFPIRTCSNGVYNRHETLGRPCLLGYIDKCAAPCVGRVDESEYEDIVAGFMGFMSGNTDKVVRDMTAQMESAAEHLEFEKAARLRDDLGAVKKVMERQTVVLSPDTDADIIAFDTDELEAAVQIFNVRGGRIRSQRGWVVEKSGDEPGSAERLDGDGPDPALPVLVQNFLVQYYSDAVERQKQEQAEDARRAAETIKRRGVDQESHAEVRSPVPVPKEILVCAMPDEEEEVTKLLEGLRGAQVNIRVPQRGDKAALMETVRKNAADALHQHKLKRVGDLTARSQALQDIQDALGMEEAPLRMECTDISHIQGTDVVASLVVFEDGLPKKQDYRRYRIKEAAGDGHSNDVGSIAEVTSRRFKRYNEDKLANPDEESAAVMFAEEASEVETTNNKRFAYPPQLFIVDGGKPQVDAAQAIFDELGVVDVQLIGLAKRLEEIWVPDDDEPVILPRNSEGMYLLQQIRDEAHRFAITYHRQQRSKRMRSSALDAIPGLGPSRRSELVKHFGSVKKMKAASVEQIEEVNGVGPKLAATIYEHLHKGE